ncbi:MAG: hypothetical protein HPY45_07105 [Anaerolineae bacterium]|nr:hypothetical protein [Anaerolineae bacterium]
MLDALLHVTSEKKHTWLPRVWLIALYLAGGWLWGEFFNWGKIPFDFHDWAEINAARLAYLQDSAVRGMLPLHASETAHLRNLTDRLLSIPDMMVSPQYLLLRWLSIGDYIVVNTLFLYSLGFLALLWLRRKFSLSLLVFSVLTFLFNFNGHLVGHFSIGHITWWAYFLLPFFFIQIVRLLEGNHTWRWVGQTSILLFFIFLQGGYHHYVWCLIFLGILALAAWKHALAILKTLVFANLISMVRLLPPALLLGKFDTDFYGGYRYPWHILEAMLLPRLPENSLPFQNFGSSLGYWEFDLYVGWVGTAFILGGTILWLKQSFSARTWQPLLVPMMVIALLSLRDFYQPFSQLPIPLLNGERVTSRMLILPLLMAMFLSAIAIQTWVDQKQPKFVLQMAFLVCLCVLGYELVAHLYRWQVTKTAVHFAVTPVNLSIKVLNNHPDPAYFQMLLVSAVISLLSLGALAYLVHREKLSYS